MFYPFQWYFDNFSKAEPCKKEKYMGVFKLFIFILIFGHFMACMWIILGGLKAGDSWLLNPVNNIDGMPDVKENPRYVWATAFYWIFEVFTTVGYGDFSYGTDAEYLFAFFSELTGVAFQSLLITNLSGIFDSYGYDVLMSNKMNELLIWSKKIENSNMKDHNYKHLTPFLFSEMQRYVRDAFLFDHNLIIEEF